jgi:hypothetical protein
MAVFNLSEVGMIYINHRFVAAEEKLFDDLCLLCLLISNVLNLEPLRMYQQ